MHLSIYGSIYEWMHLSAYGSGRKSASLEQQQQSSAVKRNEIRLSMAVPTVSRRKRKVNPSIYSGTNLLLTSPSSVGLSLLFPSPSLPSPPALFGVPNTAGDAFSPPGHPAPTCPLLTAGDIDMRFIRIFSALRKDAGSGGKTRVQALKRREFRL
jgi:hypothetical protein